MTVRETQLPRPARDYPFQPVPFTEVRVRDAFWSARLETNRAVSIPHAFRKCEEEGRISNFEIAAGLRRGEHRGAYPFDDTDPYKAIEGASYALMIQPDADLDAYLDGLIAKMAAAQEPDGYLYTCRTNKAEHLRHWFGPERWCNEGRSHELYNAGHLFEAAAAHYTATGKRSLLDVAVKNADLIEQVFGPGKNETPPGHQITEMGLARLYRITGERKYLDLARFFLDARGRGRGGEEDSEGIATWGEYNQDHLPVLEQTSAVGHAVRAVYMYAGMADVAALTGDEGYARAIGLIWENVVERKYYITGGVGARSRGEAFGDDFELPSMSAYCETCAAIGHVYWNHRLFLLHGESKYMDVLERTLYNGVLSGVSLDGKGFFYPNPLASHGQHERSAWFGCACCPGNVTRFIASVPGYAYAHRDSALYVNLFIGGEAKITLASGAVRVEQETRYPWNGAVRITVHPEKPSRFELRVRIPGWAVNQPVPGNLYRYADSAARDVRLCVNSVPAAPMMDNGYAVLQREWRNGDVVEMEMSMPARRVAADERVAACRGRVALERGPIVFCAEWPEFRDGNVFNLVLDDNQPLESHWQGDLLGGVVTLDGRCVALAAGENGQVSRREQAFRAIPYYAWAHRGRGEMSVWLARTEGDAIAMPPHGPEVKWQVSASGSHYDSGAVRDIFEPASSQDLEVRHFQWWARKGAEEWIEYAFDHPRKVSSVRVYWFDDSERNGGCRAPRSWRLLYRSGEKWLAVTARGGFGVAKDAYNVVEFEPVQASGLRMEVQAAPDWSAGVMRWRVR